MKVLLGAADALAAGYEVTPRGCHAYLGEISREGYGVVTTFGVPIPAHRLIYQIHVGPIPAGLMLDHECHTADTTCSGGSSCAHRRCVNPEHLAPVTAGENQRRRGEQRRAYEGDR
jgi:hypothetical protein